MKAHDVVRQQPVVNRLANLRRQDLPVVRLGPRNVDEVGEGRVRGLLPDEPRRQVEVVVVEEHRRVGLRLELFEDSGGKPFIDLDVALLPGVAEPVVDCRRVGELPEVVLEEPQHRVRDHVVEPVVGRLVVGDQPEPERRSVARRLVDRLTGQSPVLLRDRARDPGHVVVGDKPAQGSDQPAAAALGHALAVLPRVRDRSAVRDDDQLAPLGHDGEG